jgi:hypothetical protein
MPLNLCRGTLSAGAVRAALHLNDATRPRRRPELDALPSATRHGYHNLLPQVSTHALAGDGDLRELLCGGGGQWRSFRRPPQQGAAGDAGIPDKLRLKAVVPVVCDEPAEEQNAALAWTRRCAACVLHHRSHAAHDTARTYRTLPAATPHCIPVGPADPDMQLGVNVSSFSSSSSSTTSPFHPVARNLHLCNPTTAYTIPRSSSRAGICIDIKHFLAAIGKNFYALEAELNALLEARIVAMKLSGISAHDSHGAAILLPHLCVLPLSSGLHSPQHSSD